MADIKPIAVWNRYTDQIEEELLSDSPTTYETRPRRSPMQWITSQPLYDNLYAKMQHTHRSKKKIEPFVREHGVKMEEFAPSDPQAYPAFGDFIIRPFRPGARSFTKVPGEMPAFAEARYMGWEKLDPEQRFPVKGHSLSAERILGGAERAGPFIGGPVLLVRLSLVDYHHMHYPDSGRTLEQDWLGKRNWTVSWQALQHKEDILFENERQVNVLETTNFGRLGFVELGALNVGRIVQVHPVETPFQRGDHKSMFRFGGSAIVVFGQAGAWRPNDDPLKHTEEGLETFVRLGDAVATSLDPVTTTGP